MRLLHAIRVVSVAASISPSTVASASISTPDLSIFQNLSNNISTNLSIPSAPIDPRFHITGFNGPDTPLPQNSLLMTAVNEMAKLALLDWYGNIGSFRSHPLPGYSDISISIRTVPPEEQLDTRIAVWGLFAAIDSMRLEGRFEENEYDLYWVDSVVAVLRFKTFATLQSAMGGQRNGSESESESLDLTLPTLPSVDDSVSAEITGTPEDGRFVAECFYIVRARPLTFEEILLPIINALREVAAQPKSSYLDSAFQVPVMASRVFFAGPNARRITRRATYQYKYVIKALHTMPDFLLTNDRLAEMCMRIIVNGVYVGTGGLDKLEDLVSVIDPTS